MSNGQSIQELLREFTAAKHYGLHSVLGQARARGAEFDLERSVRVETAGVFPLRLLVTFEHEAFHQAFSPDVFLPCTWMNMPQESLDRLKTFFAKAWRIHFGWEQGVRGWIGKMYIELRPRQIVSHDPSTSDRFEPGQLLFLGYKWPLDGQGSGVVSKYKILAHLPAKEYLARWKLSHSVAVGLVAIAAGGSVSTVTSSPTVNSSISASTVTADEISVLSSSTPRGSLSSLGVNAGTLAIGVSKSELSFLPTLVANVGGTIRSRNLTVNSELKNADGLRSGDVSTTAGAGGLIGVDATFSRIHVGGSISSGIADNADLIVTGDASVSALGSGVYYSKASSNAFGLLAAGVSSSAITADVAVSANVGTSVSHSGRSLSVNAVRDIETLSETTAGSGGVAAGASASASTTQSGATTASIGQNASIDPSGDFKINARSTSETNGKVEATSGGLLAGAGATVDNSANTPVNALVMDSASVTAESIEIDAVNRFRKPNIGNNISGTTGGLVSGASTRSETVVNFNTMIDVGSNAQLTTESQDDPLTLRAVNDIQGYDKVTFTTGGAISGAGADAIIRTSADLAKINVGASATLTAAGDILISARGSGDLDTNTNVDTYGVATVAVADTRTDIRPVNQIEFQSNSRVFAEGNVLVSAGTDTSGKRDRYKMRSRADSFAGSAIPIDLIDALARLLQTNSITVHSSANIISERDIKLHAERFGFADMWAQAKGVNWASATASAINSALGGAEVLAGDVDSSATGTVTVNGRLETGVKRNVTIILGALDANNQPTGWNPETRVITTINSTDGVRINQNLSAMKSSQEQELIKARENLALYSSTDAKLAAYYRSELTRIGNELVAQGLGVYDDDGEIRFLTVDVMNVDIKPLWAQAGVIDIRGDSLVGTGVIHPPGDASVNIRNYTPAQLTIQGITIPEINGGLYVNGTLATNNAAVRDLSEDQSANFTQITAAGGTAATAPSINVKNFFEASDYVIPDGNYRSTQGTVSLVKYQSVSVSSGHSSGGVVGNTYVYIGNDGSLNLNTQNYANESLWALVVNDYVDPSIVVTGDITNYTGSVELIAIGRNANITIQASIKAADLSTVAGGSIFIDGLTSYHVGGDPYGKLKTLGDGISTYNSTAAVNLITAQGSTVNLQADSISVSAEYINLNGLIRSGKSSYSLTLGTSVTEQIDGLANTTTSRFTKLNVDSTDFNCYWDSVDRKIVVKEVRVGGGRVELTGNLLNTGSGEIQVLDGYGDIQINNNTAYDIAIERIDASQRGAGRLVLKDKGKAPSSYDYTTASGTVSIAINKTVLLPSGYASGGTPGAVYAHLGPTTATLNLSNQDYRDATKWVQVPQSTLYTRENISGALAPVDGTYTPSSNWRYGFSVGMKTATRTTTTYGSAAWLGIDALARDDGNIREQSTEVLSQPVLSAAGTYFFKASSALGNYTFAPSEVNLASQKYLLKKWETKTWYGKKTNYQKWVEESKDEEIGTHSFRADRPITINFTGETEADITVNSNFGGRILIEGPIRNTTGTTTLTTNRSIVQTNQEQAIQGRRVVLSAGTGSSHTITDARVNLAEVGAFSLLATAGGNISITETLGAMAIDKVVSTSGDTNLTAQDGIIVATGTSQSPVIQGQSITLDGGVGTLGASNKFLKLNSGTAITSKLAATSSGDIFLEEISGNLRVDQVISSLGSVALTISNGTLVDGNTTARRDDRARAALLNGVWTDLQLTASTGANTKISDTISTFSKSKARDYQTYWNWRNQFTDVSKKRTVSRIDTSSDELLFSTTHDLQPGDAVTLVGNTLPPQLTSGETYFVASVPGTDRITLSATYLGTPLDFTGESIDYDNQSISADVQPVAAYSTSQVVQLSSEEETYYREFYRNDGIEQGKSGSDLDAYVQSAINTLVQSRTDQYSNLHGFFTAYDRGGYSAEDLTRKQINDFVYTPDTPETNALTSSIKVWTEDELLYSFGAGLMAEVIDTQTIFEDDNIRGADVTIYAPNGGVGSYSTPITIDLTRSPLNLTNDERVALASAERADVVYLAGTTVATNFTFTPDLVSGDTISRNDGGSWITDGYQAGLYLRVVSNSQNATPDNAFWEIDTVSASTIRLKQKGTLIAEAGRAARISQVVLNPNASPVTLTAIEIAQRDDVDMSATGQLMVTAASAVFVGSEEDFFLKNISTQGILAVKTGEGIFNSSGHQSTRVVADDAVFEAALGGVGSSDVPLRINLLTGATLAGRADDTISIVEVSGDMLVNTLFSRTGSIELTTSAGSILDYAGNDLTDLKAGGSGSIRLTANGGAIGELGDFLDIDQSDTGVLNAQASGSIYLWETIGDSRIETVRSNTGDVYLKAHLSIIDTNGPVVDVLGNSINLESLVNSIGIAGDELDINTRFSSASGTLTTRSTYGNTYLIETLGDLYLNTITTAGSSFGFIAAPSGAILDGRLDLSTWNIDSDRVFLRSANGLGTSSAPLLSRMNFLEGKTDSGENFLVNTGLVVIGGVVPGESDGLEFGGNATIVTQSPLIIRENITSMGDLTFIATESAGTGDDITLESNISVTSQSGKVRFQAGDNVNFLTGSAVTAFNLIEILADYGDNDPAGATISLSAALVAPLIVIRGNNQNDTITLESGATTHGITVVEGYLGSDTLTNKIASSDYSNPILLFGDTVTTNYNASTRVLSSLTTTTSGSGSSDTLTNLGGFTALIGGVGADVLTGNASVDWAIGDEAQFDFIGNLIRKISSTGSGLGAADNIVVGDGDNFVLGGVGADTIRAGLGVNNILGDEGTFEVDSSGRLTLAKSTNTAVGSADLFTLGSGTYRVIAGAGNETIALGAGSNYIIGDGGLIQVNPDGTTTVASLDPAVLGTDTIQVTEGFNVIIGGSGSDTISVLSGTGGNARATILGDNGSMAFSASGVLLSISSIANDTQGASDTISITSGTNAVIGGAGADLITAGGGQNTVLGDDGEAFFFDDGTVRLIQSINLGSGANDQITLNDGVNTVIGGFGADRLVMGGGVNYVLGDEGKLEVLTSNGVATGQTVLESLNGAVGGIDDIDVGAGRNIVVGGAAGDLIDVNGNAANASAVVLGDNGSIVLTNSGTLLELRSSDFEFGGDDLINIVTGRNSVIGGRGADLITVTSGDNILFGDDAEAYFFDDGKIRLLQSINLGSGGADTIEVSDGNNKVIAGHGDDKITVQAGVLFALGDEGRFEVTDRVLGVANEILLQTMNTSMGGNDTLSIAGGRIVAFGGGADDTIQTTQGSTGQVIALGDGGEAILDSQERPVRISSIEPYSGGDDSIVLGNQDDIISGGFGDDTIDTGEGNNIAVGDTIDLLWDLYGTNRVLNFVSVTSEDPLTAGDDKMVSGSGSDVLFGGNGSDTIDAGAGEDVLATHNASLYLPIPQVGSVSGWGMDQLPKILGGDLSLQATEYLVPINLTGDLGDGADTVYGGSGNDIILTTPGGHDTIYDLSGYDTISFQLASQGVVFDLDYLNKRQYVVTPGVASDTSVTLIREGSSGNLSSMENFIGSQYSDVLYANPTSAARTFKGGLNVNQPTGEPGDELRLRTYGNTVIDSGNILSVAGLGNVYHYEFETMEWIDGAPLFLDDGDQEWFDIGFGTRILQPNLLGGDAYYLTSTKSDSSNIAGWNFSKLSPGPYQVSLSWPDPDPANIYSPRVTVRDAYGNIDAQRQIDQKTEPVVGNYLGQKWYDFGSTIDIDKDRYFNLDYNANNLTYFLADGLRVDRVRKNSAEVRVIDMASGGEIASGLTFTEFGDNYYGSEVYRDFRIVNLGTQPLKLNVVDNEEATSETQFRIVDGLVLEGANRKSLPEGFSSAEIIYANNEVSAIAPGQSAVLRIRVDTLKPGYHFGDFLLETNDVNESVFKLPIAARVGSTAQTPRFIDNTSPGFVKVTGTVTNTTQAGTYGGTQHVGRSSTKNKVSWTQTALPTANYRISTTWSALPLGDAKATYKVTWGNQTRTVVLSQQKSPMTYASSFRSDNEEWVDLVPSADIKAGDVVRIELSGGLILADAIRIQQIGHVNYPSTPMLELVDNTTGQKLSSRQGVWDFGSLQFGQTSERLLTIRNTGNLAMNLGQEFKLGPGFSIISDASTLRTLQPGASISTAQRRKPKLDTSPFQRKRGTHLTGDMGGKTLWIRPIQSEVECCLRPRNRSGRIVPSRRPSIRPISLERLL